MIRRAAWLLLALALAPGAARAQGAPEPVALASGYAPDPVRLEGRTAGARPLNALAPSCRGYVGEGPNHVLQLDTRFGFLRLFVVAPRDVTLAVRGPGDRWRCSGRPLEGAPREQGGFEPGRYEVWVGSLERGTEVAYELNVTEFQSVTPLTGQLDEAAPVGGGAELGLDVRAEQGRYRDRRLRRGFLPDPREDGGRSGGELDVGLLGGECEGHVSPRPSHVLTLRSDFDYFRIQLADATGRASLVVRTPGGRYFCSSPDAEDAFVDQDAWPQGTYHVWVGNRGGAEADRLAYRICYTEVRPAEGGVSCGSGRDGERASAPSEDAPDAEPESASPEARPDLPPADE
ncbi:MAG TPA: hypothetical protein RMH99_04500 [Sandaracinaceae bacterium LLY-WYZ-13_1]|nr:hypothetical protein [Sandaracinaceae bacterium LLY-WYZ-13_1]